MTRQGAAADTIHQPASEEKPLSQITRTVVTLQLNLYPGRGVSGCTVAFGIEERDTGRWWEGEDNFFTDLSLTVADYTNGKGFCTCSVALS